MCIRDSKKAEGRIPIIKLRIVPETVLKAKVNGEVKEFKGVKGAKELDFEGAGLKFTAKIERIWMSVSGKKKAGVNLTLLEAGVRMGMREKKAIVESAIDEDDL